jgi:hypothetical protein
MRLPEVVIEISDQLEEDVLDFSRPEVPVAVGRFVSVDQARCDCELQEVFVLCEPYHARRTPLENLAVVQIALPIVEELGCAVDESKPLQRVFVDELAPCCGGSSRGWVRWIELGVKPVSGRISIDQRVSELVPALMFVGQAEEPEDVAIAVAPQDTTTVPVMPCPSVCARATGPCIGERRGRILLLEQPREARPYPGRPRDVLVAATLG